MTPKVRSRDRGEDDRGFEFLTWTDRGGRDWGVALRWKMVGGRAEVVELRVVAPDGDFITADAVRKDVPLARIIREQRAEHAQPDWGLAQYLEQLGETGVREWVQERAKEFAGNRVLTPELLQRVAAAYLTARLTGEPVTAAVARETHCATSTAGKRIMAARRAGLLDVEEKQ